jgi:hypothetical protein
MTRRAARGLTSRTCSESFVLGLGTGTARFVLDAFAIFNISPISFVNTSGQKGKAKIVSNHEGQ